MISSALETLRSSIEAIADEESPRRSTEHLEMLAEFRAALNRGEIRVAEPEGENWVLNEWVKKGIILHRRLGLLTGQSPFGTVEFDTMPARLFGASEGVRIPATGTTVRDGAYLAPGVTCLPPSWVNIGAYVGRDSTLDSHVSVGIGVQIGERVQISAGTHIGGVIEPLDQLPSRIGDDVTIGGHCGIYDGVSIGFGAILAAGTTLTAQSWLYDPGKQQVYRSGAQGRLVVPPLSIVAMGARPITKGDAARSGLLLQVPVILGYRDDPNLDDYLLERYLE